MMRQEKNTIFRLKFCETKLPNERDSFSFFATYFLHFLCVQMRVLPTNATMLFILCNYINHVYEAFSE